MVAYVKCNRMVSECFFAAFRSAVQSGVITHCEGGCASDNKASINTSEA